MYVDESGDPGNNTSQSNYFCLTGLVVHESEWRSLIDALQTFRRKLKSIYGFPVRAEIHSAVLIRHSAFEIAKHERLAILRNTIDEISKMGFVSLTNVVVDKQTKPADYDIFAAAWRTLFQRFENTLRHGNYPGGYKRSYGKVFTDATAGKRLTQIMRKMNVYNPIPNSGGMGYRDIPILRVIEDPSERDSRNSLPIQACDVAAYFLHQMYRPNAYIKRKGAQNYFVRLEPVLNARASRTNPLGVVEI